jgi:uncharacterized protein YndB with AHSA1/START domain
VASHPVHPPEWIDDAPIRVERTVEIAAPSATVWRHIADHERWPEWFAALAEVEVTGEASGVGGRRRVTVRRAPPIDEVFTAWDPDEHFAFAVVGTKLPILAGMAESVRIEDTAGGCRVTYRQGLQARRGFGWLLSLAARRMGTQLAAALDALADIATSDT